MLKINSHANTKIFQFCCERGTFLLNLKKLVRLVVGKKGKKGRRGRRGRGEEGEGERTKVERM